MTFSRKPVVALAAALTVALFVALLPGTLLAQDTIWLPVIGRPGVPPWSPGEETLVGQAQKGPYIQGTPLTVFELNEALQQTGRSFNATLSAGGKFTLRGELESPWVELLASGQYYNEVANEVPASTLNLRALCDVRVASTFNVNLLTHLEFERVITLVGEGVDFIEAKEQAQAEILAAFGIEAEGIGASESLDISQPGDGNAALLAITSILQADRTVAELTQLLNQFVNDLKEDGEINNGQVQQALVTGMEYIKPRTDAITQNLASRYSELGIPADVPPIDDYAVLLDTVPPAVVSSLPEAGAETFIHAIIVTFNDLLDGSTVTTQTVQLLNPSDNAIAGTVSIEEDGGVSVVTFTPTGDLVIGEHTLRIDANVKDLAGNNMEAAATVALTHALVSLNVTTYPADGAVTFVGSVSIAFDTLMDHTTLNTTTIEVRNSSNVKVAGTVTSVNTQEGENSKTTTTFKPTNQLAAGAYTLKIGNGIRDAQGGAFTEAGIISFTHAPPAEVLIPAGAFVRGCDVELGYTCYEWELPLRTITLTTYYIDKYEVTNAQYNACIGAGECLTRPGSGSTKHPDYDTNPAFAEYPAILITWDMAHDYCAWVDKRLPTEAEWEKAARGSTDTRRWPWGNDAPTCDHANYNQSGESLDGTWCVGDMAEVGSYPLGASPYGVMDMSGNAAEWVNDYFRASYYVPAADSPDTNPQGPATGTSRGIRSQSFYMDSGSISTYYRGGLGADHYSNEQGFRCARTP